MVNESSDEKNAPDVPTSEEFTRTLGQITWLLTQSKSHRRREIEFIEAHVMAPLMFKQVRVFTKGKQPLAALIWAYVSEDVKNKLLSGDHKMGLQDWRSGPEVMIVDCVSPLADAQLFIDQFMSEVEAAKGKKA